MHDVLAAAVSRGNRHEAGKCQLSRDASHVAFAPIAWYSLAATAGGALTGSALGVGGAELRGAGSSAYVLTYSFAAVVALFATALQVTGRVSPLPQRHQQVPRRFVKWPSRSASAAMWGFMLGSAVFTYLHYAAAYVIAACILASGDAHFGLAVGVLYGLIRGVHLVVGAVETNGMAS